MQAKPELRSPASKVVTIANAFRWIGWLSLCLQVGFGIATAVTLGLAARSSPVLGEEPTPGITIGIFWAVCGSVMLLVAIAITARYLNTARLLMLPDAEQHPKAGETFRTLRLATLLGLVGMAVMLIGAGSSVALLLAKATAQLSGATNYSNPQQIIRALDLYVVAANLNGIAAHFVGATAALGLTDWLRKQ